MSKLGAFVAGLGTGVASGHRMRLESDRASRERERASREGEQFEMQKDAAKRARTRQEQQDAVYPALASLVEEFTGQSQPGATAPSNIAAKGVMMPPAVGGQPSAPPDDGAGVITTDPPDLQTGQVTYTASAPHQPAPVDMASRGVTMPPAARTQSEAAPERTPEQRYGFGVYQNPDLFGNPQFLNRAAKIFLDARLPEGVRYLEAAARLQRENWPKAMRSLMAGDTAGAEEAFNASGRLKVQPGSTKEIGDGKFQATLESGETKTFDPRQYMRAMVSPKDFFDLESKQQELASRDKDRTAQRDAEAARLAETSRHNKAMEGVQRELLQFRKANGKDSATALMKNVNYLVESGVAKDHREAFTQLRTAMEKPEDDAVLAVAKTLMTGPKYMGKNGAAKAMEDAQQMVNTVKQGKRRGGASFKSAEDVRTAFRAGTIDRATAIKELSGFGLDDE